MITNIGKNLLAKYLIGQAPSYASHIAIGCGARPKPTDYVPTSTDLAEISEKKNLDFEMFRVPIVSRGYVTEYDEDLERYISKIVLTAELPTIERYEITEIGIFSSGSNPTAGAYDSKPVYSFTKTENWEYHNQDSAITIPTVTDALGTSEDPEIIAPPYEVFQTNADNKTLLNETRLDRYESCRNLNNTIFIPGDSSSLSMSGSRMIAEDGSNHIHLTGASLDFNKNSADDELRLSFSVVSKDVLETLQPFRVVILVEFADSDATSSENYAQFQINLANGTDGTEENPKQDFENNRYVVETRTLGQLIKNPSFTWNSVNVIKIWASVEDSAGNPDPKFYVALDALRLENVTTVNPLYGMSGYSVVRSPDLRPIVKVANTANLVEFRFALDVDLDMANDD
jgi:hypothetical protein